MKKQRLEGVVYGMTLIEALELRHRVYELELENKELKKSVDDKERSILGIRKYNLDLEGQLKWEKTLQIQRLDYINELRIERLQLNKIIDTYKDGK